MAKYERREVPTEEPKTEHVALTDNVHVTEESVEAKADEAPSEKSLDAVSMETVPKGTQTYGDPGAWKMLCKAWNDEEGWMKTTKVMQVGAYGCLVQVTTQQKNPDGTYSVAEAVCFADRVSLSVNGQGVARFM
ncbi:hypothetical protein KJ782_07045 [Patescibacteria group bacterium]|nr:hypothetical protein [Patescibacteria group bacterium]